MKTVTMDDLKRNLSSLVSEAAAGEQILVTRHRRPVVTPSSAVRGDVHVGVHLGDGVPPLLHRATQGRILEALRLDRRGGEEL